jgi:hypothetical protein
MNQSDPNPLLCFSCGLCCSGVVCGTVALSENEVAWARDNALAPAPENQGFIFHLPCALLSNNHCSKYDQRPYVCQKFVCKTLNNYIQNKVSYSDALKIIDRLKEAEKALRSRLDPEQTQRSIWPCLNKAEELSPFPMMEFSQFFVLLKKYFVNLKTETLIPASSHQDET